MPDTQPTPTNQTAADPATQLRQHARTVHDLGVDVELQGLLTDPSSIGHAGLADALAEFGSVWGRGLQAVGRDLADAAEDLAAVQGQPPATRRTAAGSDEAVGQ